MDATTGIFRSPLEVWITFASWRKIFSFFQCLYQSTLIFIRHQIPALGIRADLQRIHHRSIGALERIMFQKFWRYSSAAQPVLVYSLLFMGLPVRGLFTGRFSSASSAS